MSLELYHKAVITGCDARTEWQLLWFINNYKQHNDLPLMVADFGMSSVMHTRVSHLVEHIFPVISPLSTGWHLKPRAMLTAPCRQVCWLDTDCEVLGDISGIFDAIEPNKLAMVQDRPWTRRRPAQGKWFNTGVVAFEKTPEVMYRWERECTDGAGRGDQEILHSMLGNDFNRLIHITELDNKYNCLRLQIDDQDTVFDIRVFHWTGRKGDDVIREKIGRSE